MRNFVLGVVITLLVVIAGGFLYLQSGLLDVRGDLPPSRLETYLMRTAVHASVRRHAENVANPLPPTEENLIAGGKMYLNECSGCHGTPGKAQEHADPLNPPPPQLAVVGTQYSEPQVFWVAKHGIRHSGMFANGVWDSDQKLWTVAGYIKRMNNLPPRVKEALEEKPKSAGQ